MRQILISVFALAFMLSGNLMAEKAESLQQAKELSVKVGKPILMEFVHED